MLQKAHLVCVCVCVCVYTKNSPKKHRDMVRLAIPTDKQNTRQLFVGFVDLHYITRRVCTVCVHTQYNDRRDDSKKKKMIFYFSYRKTLLYWNVFYGIVWAGGSYKRKCRHSCTVYIEWTLGQISARKVFLNRIMFYNIYVCTHAQGT